MRWASPRNRAPWLALWSVGLLPGIVIVGASANVRLNAAPRFLMLSVAVVALYIATLIVAWLLLRAWGRDESPRFWIAFGFPIFVMVVVRFIPGEWHFYFK